MPREQSYDVVVIGGGPAGACAATVLADAGRSVLVCERERFPRFHVGESLLPYSAPQLRRLGVWQQLLDRGFQRKFGGHFMFEPGFGCSRIDFSTSLDPDLNMAFQVRRAEFDDILLRNAAAHGAEVIEAVSVDSVIFEPGRVDEDRVVKGRAVKGRGVKDRAVGVRLAHQDGETREIQARVVLDGSGRGTVLARQLGLVERDPVFRQASLYTHVRGARLGLGPEGGDILIVGGPFGWFWLIPLDANTASVGAVFPGQVLAQVRQSTNGDPQRGLEHLFEQLVAASPIVHERLAGSERILPVVATADFSYRCRKLAGDGWMLVGDAAGFVDPVFSSGVMLALATGERAADLTLRGLAARGRLRRRDARRYERFARRGLERFRRFITAFYDPGGLRTFLDPPPRVLARAVSSVFAGKVFARDPRVWISERAFFLQCARYRKAAARGKLELPQAPAV